MYFVFVLRFRKIDDKKNQINRRSIDILSSNQNINNFIDRVDFDYVIFDDALNFNHIKSLKFHSKKSIFNHDVISIEIDSMLKKFKNINFQHFDSNQNDDFDIVHINLNFDNSTIIATKKNALTTQIVMKTNRIQSYINDVCDFDIENFCFIEI